MLRLAWHFSVRSGREAITRLLVTASVLGLVGADVLWTLIKLAEVSPR